MKKSYRFYLLSAVFILAMSVNAYANVGDMGFFGGISEGRKLPKTTQILLASDKNKNTKDTFIYKEIILLNGTPLEFEGEITIDSKISKIKEGDTKGTYEVAFNVKPSAASIAANLILNREITFTVNYRKEGSQIVRDYEVKKRGQGKDWTESIITPSGEYYLDASRSHFSVSTLEDETAGVTYAKGNISITSVYTSGDGDEANAGSGDTTVSSTGSLYGYTSAWSSTETHRIDTWVYAPGWQMQYQLRPSVSVNKTLQYSPNEPTAISFTGNYMEVIANKSSLSYDVLVKPTTMFGTPDKGSVTIPSYNSFEQLIAPDTNFLKGHFAEYDINKLFSMQVLSGNPLYYKPEQAITRGQYVEALVKAIKLPVDKVDTSSKAKKKTAYIVFPDVTESRSEYPYIMAAYKAGLAIGRDTGNFFIDSPISRQEAIVILVRTLGLENLGLDPTPVTSFTDDSKIASWAKKEIYAANRLGLISGDADGKIKPLENLSKAEGAAFVNRLIDYMRYDLATDYTEHIVNYIY